MEKVLAVYDRDVAEVVEEEKQQGIGRQAADVSAQAEALAVTDAASYANAGSMLKVIKGVQRMVKDYWEPLRKNAKLAYDAVLDKRDAMLKPVNAAEAVIKRKMADYSMAEERKRREEEARLRELLRAESDKKLDEAVKMEAAGDAAGADFALTEAEAYDTRSESVTVAAQATKVDGVSTRKTWRINVVDPALVPISVGGVEIRPVDTAAVLRLVKVAKGNIQIPGIEIVEDVTMVARA